MAAPALAQAQVWQADEVAVNRGMVNKRDGAYFSSEFQALRGLLAAAPRESSRGPRHIITLPLPDGSRARFSIVESPVMAQALADKFPQIQTYRIVGVDDPSANGRVDITPRGFHAMVHNDRGRFTIDPEAGQYRVRWRKGGDGKDGFQCGTESLAARGSEVTGSSTPLDSSGPVASRISNDLMVYRLAVSATVDHQ